MCSLPIWTNPINVDEVFHGFPSWITLFLEKSQPPPRAFFGALVQFRCTRVASLNSWGQLTPMVSGWWLGHPSEKYESIGMIRNPIYGKIKKVKLMFQTTNQVLSPSLGFFGKKLSCGGFPTWENRKISGVSSRIG